MVHQFACRVFSSRALYGTSLQPGHLTVTNDEGPFTSGEIMEMPALSEEIVVEFSFIEQYQVVGRLDDFVMAYRWACHLSFVFREPQLQLGRRRPSLLLNDS